jgi:hypothetical protein
VESWSLGLFDIFSMPSPSKQLFAQHGVDTVSILDKQEKSGQITEISRMQTEGDLHAVVDIHFDLCKSKISYQTFTRRSCD